MNICIVSQGLDNPIWSSANFLADGFSELKEHKIVMCRPKEFIPEGMDLYVDIECGYDIIPDRSKFRPVVAVMMDIFDSEINKKIKFEQARTADFVTVMADCDRKMLEGIGIKVSGLINWGLYSKIWHKIDCAKTIDAGFIGNIERKMSSHRRDFILALRKKFNIVKAQAYLEDNAKFISSGRVGLSLPNLGFEGLNQRINEIIGCQLPLLTRNMAGIRDFLPNQLVTFYNGIDDICDRFQEILDNYEEKSANAGKLFDFMEKNHSYKVIAQRILDIVNGEKYDLDYYRSLSKGCNL